MELQENKLKSLTLQEKLELIAIIEAGRSVKDVAEEYAVNRNTLHYILKNREKIRAGINAQPGISGFKRIKKTKCPELEKRVLEFMYESREKNEKLSGSSIKAMALEFASELQVENFSASNGWLFAFFKRNQITISEFNKNVGPQHETPLKEVTDKTIIDEEPYEDELTENVSDDLARIEEVSYDYSSNNELFETVEEEEQKLELTDSSWRSWCRMCGDYDTLPVLDSPNIEVVQQLFDVS